jgi:NAD(P)-dependent dehydrogenase (short-subunit alcohol dehydrogenase family)
MPRLDSKVALVTGAARGIGEAVARAFVAEGARVLITDIRDDLGGRVAASLGDAAEYRRLDVREEADWIDATDAAVERWGQLEIVVNNAGVTGFEGGPAPHDPEHASQADWRAVHRTNLDGVFLGCKHAIRTMRQGGSGAIVNISSRSGLVGIPAAAAYASSKAAVRNHTKTVALYCAGQGLNIRCNSVHPAAVLTPIWEPMLGDGPDREERARALTADTPLKRFGTVEEVAAVVVLLASDEAAYMTGSEVNIDGGLLAGSAATPTTE